MKLKKSTGGKPPKTGYCRALKHEEEVVKKDLQNAFAKHLAINHPDRQGNISPFTIKVKVTFKKPLPREVIEAVKMQSTKAEVFLNSKSKHKQPKLNRIVMTRENDEPEVRG